MKVERIFFIISLRLVRPSIAESFSLTGEGHCIGGRFPMELLRSKWILIWADIRQTQWDTEYLLFKGLFQISE